MNKMFGLALVVVGVVLLVMGISATDSIASQFSRLFTGKSTDKSIWLIVLGTVSLLVGIGGWLSFRGRSKTA